MTSKERVRAAMQRKRPDRVPAAFEAVGTVCDKLMRHYGFTDYSELLEKFEIDIISAGPRYIGPELKSYYNEKGELVTPSYWGQESTLHTTEIDTYSVTTRYPLTGLDTIEKINEGYRFPSPDWFDYDAIRKTCEKYPDKAIILGHEGPFQHVNALMKMDEFFMLMYDDPETASYILNQMVNFELEYYRRCFEAARGGIDILRPHDDYGTQISLLFSVDMWKYFFKENTKKLTALAHEYGAFYQQHSCGAVAPIIPQLIECGVDSLEPLQKVPGLYPEELLEHFGGKITFHGGIDTQQLLPYGTPEEVAAETDRYIQTLGQNGGYILMASQGFEGDVPIENIEAVYRTPRIIR